MKRFHIDETTKKRAGFFVTKRIAVLGAILLSLAIVGVVLVTYFAKPEQSCSISTNDATTQTSTSTRSPPISST
jgi:hypothetical protein